MDTEQKKAIPEMAVETRLLVQEFGKLAEDEFRSYTHLMQLTSCNMLRLRGYINTAREYVLREKGIVIGCVRAEGVKRIANANVVDVGRSALKSIRNKAKKTGRKLTCVDITRLSQDQRTGHLAVASGVAMIAHCASGNRIKQLEPLCQSSSLELPVGRVLEVLRGD